MFQVLQTFHRAKAFKGSPLKVAQLQTICGKDSAPLVFDTRPEPFWNSEEMSDRFRIACLNLTPQVITLWP